MQLSDLIQNFFFCSSFFGSSSIAFICRLELYLIDVEQAHLAFHDQSFLTFICWGNFADDYLIVISTIYFKWFLGARNHLKRTSASAAAAAFSQNSCNNRIVDIRKKSEFAIDETLDGSRCDWSHTRHIQSCIYFICNKEDTASVSLLFKRRLWWAFAFHKQMIVI